MMPEDDPSWPVCQDHAHNDSYPTDQHWCDWTRDYIVIGKDAEDILSGSRICVPVVPQLGFYVEVSIDSEMIAGMTAQLSIVGHEVPFSPNEELFPLGMWMKGEGRLIIGSAITDWMNGQAYSECKATSHGFKQEMQVKEFKSSAAHLKANKWCLAYYGRCWPCRNETLTPDGNSPVSFTASSFGLNASEFNTAVSGTSSRQQQVSQQLRQRFGNRTASNHSTGFALDLNNDWPQVAKFLERYRA